MEIDKKMKHAQARHHNATGDYPNASLSSSSNLHYSSSITTIKGSKMGNAMRILNKSNNTKNGHNSNMISHHTNKNLEEQVHNGNKHYQAILNQRQTNSLNNVSIK